ncbi:FliG C-terminal domain-containing protein [Leptospira biflexa]|uniref:FliG C-terminal domain-containing protein n=1 Tax=Leptospira biflexa TaxID=172 RepID=UPI001083A908|nr:FliG C-terminal domain-containing protein [Leptospira biflexa]TGM31866.1 endoflagellar motor switch protein [Leptospira biflexa]TGM37008.1 endoflagellar motor switch protein [Leptospira biflexa]
MAPTSGPNKAALAYQILGQYLPDEVFAHLTDAEIESLLLKVETNPSPTKGQEKDLLLSFTNFLKKKGIQDKKTDGSPSRSGIDPVPHLHFTNDLSSSHPPSNRSHPETNELYSLLDEILKEEDSKRTSPLWPELPKFSTELLRNLSMDESPEVVARLLSFSDPETASEVLSDYPESLREEVILALAEIDFHSDRERDQLERFLRFKMELIEKKMPVSKIRSRKAKTAGEILTRLPFLPSQNLIERIQKKSPEYAETIVEHYFRLEDLLHLGRTSLTRFFSEIHPLVIACALKGVETEFRDQVYSNLESWLVKEIKIEWDSLGPVSLAEIEEAQKGILDRLREAMDEGKVKLWRLK